MFIGSDKARSGGDRAAQRVGRPEGIPQTIMFLASGKASCITDASYLKDEHGTILAEGNFVIVHGRFSNFGLPVNWIAADIVRIKDGVLVEHWDVIQDEATQEQSKSGQPMFGRTFATYASAR